MSFPKHFDVQWILLACITCALPRAVDAQIQEQDIIERSIEVIAELNEDAELDYTTLIDELTYYLERPLDLNRADEEELRAIRLLSDRQIKSLLEHRDRFGRIVTFEELQVIPSMDLQTLRNIRPFLRTSGDLDDLRISLKDLWERGGHELFLRSDRVLEDRRGYTLTDPEDPNSRAYPGDPWRHFIRYRFSYGNRVSVGFTTEKDPGETMLKGGQPAMDFFSAHAYVRGLGTVDKLAIGDFQAQMGQGLVMWSGLAFGKGADLFMLKRNPRGITPYRSVDENRFLRGAAVTLKSGDFRLTAFGSSKKRDGNVATGDTLDIEQAVSFTSFQLSGLHRTDREIEDRKQVQEDIYGGELVYGKGGLHLGARAVRYSFDRGFTGSERPDDLFDFRGSDRTIVGLDYDYVKGNLDLYGEVARSDNGGVAVVNGAYLVMDPRLTFAAHHRYYSRDYQNLFSNAVVEGTIPIQNEQSLLMGLIFKPKDKWTYFAWMDRFSFPWLRFRVDRPQSDGHEFMTQLTYRPKRSVEYYVRYRTREIPRNEIGERPIDVPGFDFQRSLRFNLRYPIAEGWSIRNRLEWVWYDRAGGDRSNGFLIYQDLLYRPSGSPIDLSLRYALFDTESSDARLYAFEQDVLYFYSIPLITGVGARYYAVLRWRVTRGVDFWVKWARWNYRNRDTISSGNELIDGNQRTDLRIQLRWRF